MGYIEDIVKIKREALEKVGSPLCVEFNDDHIDYGFICLYLYFNPDDISMGELKGGVSLFFDEVFINNKKINCFNEKELQKENKKYKLKLSTKIKSWLIKRLSE